MESVFEHVKGVTNVVSGYAGGNARDANYDAVSSESTGHAEAVKITYDPAQISYAQLLQIYFTVAHDPTEVEPPGPGLGPQLSLGDLPADRRSRLRIRARRSSRRLNARPRLQGADRDAGSRAAASIRPRPITRASRRKHPDYPYIVINDRPKVAALQRQIPRALQSAA